MRIIQLVKSYAKTAPWPWEGGFRAVRRGLSAPVKTRTVNGLWSLMSRRRPIPYFRASEALEAE